MFDVNHGFAFTVHACARIPAAPAARRSRGQTLVCLGSFKESQRRYKLRAALLGSGTLFLRGQTAAQRGVR